MAEPFRPNLFQPISSRVSSEPQSPPSNNSKKSHLRSLHHHPHRHHHHRHGSRHHAKEAVQSAIQLHPPTSFGDLLKQAKGSDSSTPTHSRNGSVKEPNGRVDGQPELPVEKREVRKPVRPEDVEKERKRVKIREEELRSSLQNLSDQSLKTSRHLDDTYYSILEKVSQLRQTIGSLQELSSLTKELHENFQSDTKELVEDIQGQFEGFNNFDDQQEQVTALEARIKAGKEKAETLNTRLAEAKKRVDTRAKSEAELEARNTRRLRILWSILGIITSFVIMAILFQQFKPIHPDSSHEPGLDFTSRAQILDADIPDIAKEAIMSSSSTPAIRIETPSVNSAMELKEDDRLRVFDEL